MDGRRRQAIECEETRGPLQSSVEQGNQFDHFRLAADHNVLGAFAECPLALPNVPAGDAPGEREQLGARLGERARWLWRCGSGTA